MGPGDLDIESQLHNLPPEILRQILISLLRGPENNASGQAGNPVASTAGLANIDEPDQNANPNLIGISSPNGGTLSIAEPDSTTNVERVQVLDNTREVSNSINQASRSASGTERPIFLGRSYPYSCSLFQQLKASVRPRTWKSRQLVHP